jgi:hypothetical protein
LLLGFELLVQMPASPRQWRLEFFAFILLLLLMTMGLYWIKKFQALWLPLLGVLIKMVALVVLSALLTHLLTKTVSAIACRFFHWSIPPERMQRFRQACLCVFLVLSMLGLA